MIVADYQLDVGYILYGVPLRFSVDIKNDSISLYSAQEILPAILAAYYVDNPATKSSCVYGSGITPRQITITADDSNLYTAYIPFRPYQDDWYTMLDQLEASARVKQYAVRGERLASDRLVSILRLVEF